MENSWEGFPNFEPLGFGIMKSEEEEKAKKLRIKELVRVESTEGESRKEVEEVKSWYSKSSMEDEEDESEEYDINDGMTSPSRKHNDLQESPDGRSRMEAIKRSAFGQEKKITNLHDLEYLYGEDRR